MITFQDAKQELKKANRTLKHFTKSFFNLYIEEREAGFKNIFTTDFYKKNSVAYCEFLSIYENNL